MLVLSNWKSKIQWTPHCKKFKKLFYLKAKNNLMQINAKKNLQVFVLFSMVTKVKKWQAKN